jgi:hypothetical protein
VAMMCVVEEGRGLLVMGLLLIMEEDEGGAG